MTCQYSRYGINIKNRTCNTYQKQEESRHILEDAFQIPLSHLSLQDSSIDQITLLPVKMVTVSLQPPITLSSATPSSSVFFSYPKLILFS